MKQMSGCSTRRGRSVIAVQNVARRETAQLRHRAHRSRTAPSSHHRHRGKARARRCPVDAGGRGALRPHPAHLPSPRMRSPARRRDPAHRRHRRCLRRKTVFGYDSRAPAMTAAPRSVTCRRISVRAEASRSRRGIREFCGTWARAPGSSTLTGTAAESLSALTPEKARQASRRCGTTSFGRRRLQGGHPGGAGDFRTARRQLSARALRSCAAA